MVAAGMKNMDLNLLRTAVFEKTGIKVDTEDPIFALVALHETVLEQSVAHQLQTIEEATAQLQRQTDALLDAGNYLKALLQAAGHPVDGVDGVEQALATSNAETATEIRTAALPTALRIESRWIIGGCMLAVFTALLTTAGVWLTRLH